MNVLGRGRGDQDAKTFSFSRALPHNVLPFCRLMICVYLKPQGLSPQWTVHSVTLSVRKQLPQVDPRATSFWGPGEKSPSTRHPPHPHHWMPRDRRVFARPLHDHLSRTLAT